VSPERELAPNEDGLVGDVEDLMLRWTQLFSVRVDVAKRSLDFHDGRVGVRSRVRDFEPLISYFVTDREMLTSDFRKLASPAGSSAESSTQ
jgi:hypothetical protein